MTKLLLATTALCGPARAFADLNFDATTVTPDAGFEALPSGWYNAQIDESEMKPTQDGTGSYLKLRFNVLDGQYAGRKVYTNLNLRNQSTQAVEIAQKQLSAICHATGIMRVAKSEELHGKPLKIKVAYKAASGNYGEGNEIKSYKNKDEQVDMAGGDAGAAAFGAGGPKAPDGFGGGAAAPAAGGDATTQPWAQAPAAAAADAPSAEPAPQPWAKDKPAEGPAAPAPEAPAAPAAPAAEHDAMAAAVADGWIKHPTGPGYHYKGDVVKTDADVAAMYPAPAAAPAVPAAPPAPPAAPAAPAGETAPPPWAQKA